MYAKENGKGIRSPCTQRKDFISQSKEVKRTQGRRIPLEKREDMNISLGIELQ